MLEVDGIMQDYTEAVENKIDNKGKQHSQTNSMEIQIGGRTKTKDFDGSSVVMDMDHMDHGSSEKQHTYQTNYKQHDRSGMLLCAFPFTRWCPFFIQEELSILPSSHFPIFFSRAQTRVHTALQ